MKINWTYNAIENLKKSKHIFLKIPSFMLQDFSKNYLMVLVIYLIFLK